MRSAESEKMGQPTKAERRERQLNVKLTAREHGWVVRMSQMAGLRPVEFGRLKLLADRPLRGGASTPKAHLDPLLLSHLSRVGNNLNQIARKLHQLNFPAPSELGEVLEEIRGLLRKASGDDS